MEGVGSHNLVAYIIVMDMKWWDHQDKNHSRDGDDDDESYPPINGRQTYEVGWTKVC